MAREGSSYFPLLLGGNRGDQIHLITLGGQMVHNQHFDKMMKKNTTLINRARMKMDPMVQI